MKYTEESLDELIKWVEHLDRIVGLKNTTLVDVFDTVAHAKEKLKNDSLYDVIGCLECGHKSYGHWCYVNNPDKCKHKR